VTVSGAARRSQEVFDCTVSEYFRLASLAETKTITKHGWDWLLPAILFFATAAIVLWQNLRLGILWDLSYILETSYVFRWATFRTRFSLPTRLDRSGCKPLIKLTGRVFFHHVIYAAAPAASRRF